MKKLLLFGNFLLLTLVMHAQTDYFLFIQSENNQTFYVQSDGKTLSSSSAGHLIIPSLRDSTYTLNVGFPKNQFPEQVFQVRINKRDAGYQLKNMGAEGWALFNLQTLQLIKAQQADAKKQTISYGDIKRTDVFSTLMAGLVNDSAVLYTSIAKVSAPKERSETSISDTPVSGAVVIRNQHLTSDSSIVRMDTAVIKAEVVTIENSKRKDTLRVPSVFPQTEEPTRQDTVAALSEPSRAQSSKVVDSVLVKTTPPKPDSVNTSETVQSETTSRTSKQGNDTAAGKTVASAELPHSEIKKDVDNIPVAATEKKSMEGQPVLKPLVVWFSETKTERGIELVYFDMSLPDKTDTINILIPAEEIPRIDTKKDTNEAAPDPDENKGKKNEGSGNKFFGKLFGKNDNAKGDEPKADKRSSKQKESTIKVTTVEDKRPVGSSAAAEKKQPNSEGEVAAKAIEKKDDEAKTSSGSFFDRVFGKKNNKTSVNDSVRNGGNASVKVTTVESKSSKLPDSSMARSKKNGSDDATEVEKLRKAQENEDKTSTERFFGRIFGKKNTKVKGNTGNSSSQNTPEASIKVTTVPPPAGKENKERAKVSATNSDCRDFASDYDTDKLRVRMLGEKDPDVQVTEARKLFKAKCVTTKQVQALSTLFQTDEGKYKLFDAAYPYVSDSVNFKDLVELLSEEYYVNRFKAMVRM